jgi:signal transduction histidine kinase
MPLPTLPLRAVLYTVCIYLLVVILMMPIFLSRAHRVKLENIVSDGAFIARMTPEARAFFSPPDDNAPAHENHQIQIPIRAITILGADEAPDQTIWLSDPPPNPEILSSVDLANLSQWANLMRLIQIYTLPEGHLMCVHDHDVIGGSNVEVVISVGALRAYLNSVSVQIWSAALLLLLPLALILRVVLRRVVLQSLDELFIGLYGRGLTGSPDEIAGGQQAVANVDRFHERLQAHIDEQARLASLGAGASHLAHDIRNLLASLQLNAERLQASEGARERKLGTSLEGSIQQALTLVDWAAMYTSTKRENLNVSHQQVGPIVDEAMNFVRLHDPRREVTLVNDCPKRLGISAERTLLFRVLFNLTLNAVQALKYSNQPKTKKKRVRVSARRVDDGIEISVIDNGPGLPKEGRHELMMPHIARATPTGTGLGLKIATDLVSWHGGDIRLDRSDGRGTKFVIKLPSEPRHKTDEAPATAIDPVSATG